MDIVVEKVTVLNAAVMERMTEIEAQAFGEGGLNIWTLVPLLRHGRVFALRDGQHIIGGAQFMRDWEDNTRAYLVGIALDALCRGKGLGTRFLSECMDALKREGIACVELTVDAANVAAVRVYREKLGFEVLETRKGEYGPGVDRVVMQKVL